MLCQTCGGFGEVCNLCGEPPGCDCPGPPDYGACEDCGGSGDEAAAAKGGV